MSSKQSKESPFDRALAFLEGCTRVEVIDEKGRSYVNWNENNSVQVSRQDDGRTLKIFVTRKNK